MLNVFRLLGRDRRPGLEGMGLGLGMETSEELRSLSTRQPMGLQTGPPRF